MTPEQIARAGTEHAHQCAVLCWSGSHAPAHMQRELALLHAIPNGGGRSPSQGSRLKAEGVKPGVPDLMLPVMRLHPIMPDVTRHQGSRPVFGGLYIEMKKPGETARKNQTEWHVSLMENGYAVSVCDHWEKAIYLLEQYLSFDKYSKPGRFF